MHMPLCVITTLSGQVTMTVTHHESRAHETMRVNRITPTLDPLNSGKIEKLRLALPPQRRPRCSSPPFTLTLTETLAVTSQTPIHINVNETRMYEDENEKTLSLEPKSFKLEARTLKLEAWTSDRQTVNLARWTLDLEPQTSNIKSETFKHYI